MGRRFIYADTIKNSKAMLSKYGRNVFLSIPNVTVSWRVVPSAVLALMGFGLGYPVSRLVSPQRDRAEIAHWIDWRRQRHSQIINKYTP